MLQAALDDFASTLASRFLLIDKATTQEALEAYAGDHHRETLILAITYLTHQIWYNLGYEKPCKSAKNTHGGYPLFR